MKYTTLDIDGQLIRVGVKPGGDGNPPLLLCNGIGANQEMLRPFAEAHAFKDTEIITFDVPGIGGSSVPLLPFRVSQLSRLIIRILDQLNYARVDVLGVSWGGGLAQQFAKDHPDRCRRLILAATSMGQIAVPPKLGVMLKMATPRRYFQPSYMEKVGASIYGGVFRRDKKILRSYRSSMRAPSFRGYLYQLMAIGGWTSIHWLHKLRQPTLILAGDDDPLIPVPNAKIMNYLIPNSQLELMHCGHLFMMTLSEYTAEVVHDFLGKPDFKVMANKA